MKVLDCFLSMSVPSQVPVENNTVAKETAKEKNTMIYKTAHNNVITIIALNRRCEVCIDIAKPNTENELISCTAAEWHERAVYDKLIIQYLCGTISKEQQQGIHQMQVIIIGRYPI